MQKSGHEGRRAGTSRKYARVVELNENEKEFRYVIGDTDEKSRHSSVETLKDFGFVPVTAKEAEELGVRLAKNDVLLRKPLEEWAVDKKAFRNSEQFAPEGGSRVVDGVEIIASKAPRREAVRFNRSAK